MIISKSIINGIEILTAQNDFIRCEIAPTAGGKIISVFNKGLNKEFLWSNRSLSLQLLNPGSDYDSNFWGGIDELIPNDIPETIDSVSYPDHGELWTTSLQHEASDEKIKVYGKLPLSGLYYEKTLYLDHDLPIIHLNYRIINQSGSRKNFLWKLHAALTIGSGDKLVTDARKARIVDPEYSRFKDIEEFNWPIIENTNASIVPFRNNTMDFFYLYDLYQGEMQLENESDGSLFVYNYDKQIFPYQWYFASYGKFFGHFTAILEPCTTMPISVNDAKINRQCSMLEPGQEINTSVRIYAGEKNNYSNNV